MKNKSSFFLSALLLIVGFLVIPAQAAYKSPNIASDAYVEHGKKFFKQKDYDRSITEFNKALLIDPQHEEAILYLRMLGFGDQRCPTGSTSWACADREAVCGLECQKKKKDTVKQQANLSKEQSLEKAVIQEKSSRAALKKQKAALKKQRAQAAKEEKAYLKQVEAELKAKKLKDVQQAYKEKHVKGKEASAVIKGEEDQDGFAVGVATKEKVSGTKGGRVSKGSGKTKTAKSSKTTPKSKAQVSTFESVKGKAGEDYLDESGELDEKSLYLPDSQSGYSVKKSTAKSAAAQSGKASKESAESDEDGFAVGVGMSESKYGETGEGTQSGKASQESAESDEDGFAVGVGMSESKYGETGETSAGKSRKKVSAKKKSTDRLSGVRADEEDVAPKSSLSSGVSEDSGKGVTSDQEQDENGFAIGVPMSESRYGQVGWGPDGTRSPELKKEYKGLDALIAKLESLEDEKAALDQDKTMSKAKKAMAQKRLLRDIKATKAQIKAVEADIQKKEKKLAKAAKKKGKSSVSTKNKVDRTSDRSDQYQAKAPTKAAIKTTADRKKAGPSADLEDTDSSESLSENLEEEETEPSVSSLDEGAEYTGGAASDRYADTLAEVNALSRDLEPQMSKEQKYELAKIRAKNAKAEKEILKELNQSSASQKEFDSEDASSVSLQDDQGEEMTSRSIENTEEDAEASPAVKKSSQSRSSKSSRSLAAENAELRQKLDDIIAMSQQDQETIQRLEAEKAKTPEDKARIKSSIAKTGRDVEDRRAALKDESARMQELYDRVQELEDELNSRKYDFKDNQLDYEKKIQDIMDQFEDLKYAKSKSESEFLDQLRTLKDALKKKIAELNATEEKLLFTEYKLKKLQEKYSKKNTQFDALQKTLLELESRMSELQGKIGEEDAELGKLELSNMPPPKTREEAIYQRWIQRHDRLVNKLKEKLLWAHQQMDYYGQYDIKISEDKMAVLKQEIAALKKQLNAKDPFPGAKKEDYELMEERLKDTQERLDMVEKILKEKDAQIQELENQLNGALSNF